jgi:hypothetical protein
MAAGRFINPELVVNAVPLLSVSHHVECKLAFIRSFSKPDRNELGRAINSINKADPPTALVNVLLIDTDRVGPDHESTLVREGEYYSHGISEFC